MPFLYRFRSTLFGILVGMLMMGSFATDVSAQNVDSSLVARFQLADSYVRAGQFQRAITLLEDLYDASPATFVFYERLKDAYENVKEYDKAIALVQARIEREPPSATPVYTAEKARLLYLKDDEQGAYDTWDSVLDMAPAEHNTYRTVYLSLFRVRLFEKSIEVLELGREQTGKPDLYLVDLAQLYSLTGDYTAAMEEYLYFLGQNEHQLNFVQNKLSRYVAMEGMLDKSIPVTEAATRQAPLNLSYRELLGWLYLENDDYSKGLNVYRAIDRLEQKNGQALLEFAQKAADGEAFDVASQAYAEVLERYAQGPAAPHALFARGEMLERQAEKADEQAFDGAGQPVDAPLFGQAVTTYEQFLTNYPTHPQYPEALRRLGRLNKEVFYDLDAAATMLQQVVDRYPGTGSADQASFDLGEIAILKGELGDARLAFSRLVSRLQIGELADRARYELVLLHFYQGEFEAAGSLSQVMNENTSTDVANDAIGLRILFMENKGPDSLDTALRNFAEAALLERQRDFDGALVVLDSLKANFGFHPIADETHYLRAETLMKAGRVEEAQAALSEFPLVHPNSHLVDRSYFTLGQLYENLGDAENARDAYTKLITQFPGSLMTKPARDRIRALRGDGT